MVSDENGLYSYIRELKQKFPPFKYEEPTVVRCFMLNYDQSAEDSLDDFTALLIAALHAGGAHVITSFVPGCILFQAEAIHNRSGQTVQKWLNHLVNALSYECKFVICIIKQYSNTEAPIFGVYPNDQREEKFDELQQWVIERFNWV